MQDKIRVLIVDDHLIVRMGTELILQNFDEIEVVGLAKDGEEALMLLAESRPDVMLLDLLMPGLSPVEVIEKALELEPTLQILLVTGVEEGTELDNEVLQAIRAGVSGYLSKGCGPRELAQAIIRLNDGQSFFPTRLTREAMGGTADALKELTDREVEILRLVALGWDNHKIAKDLNIAEVTARTHVSRLLSKLRLSRTEAVLFALKHGIVHLKERPDI